ncbi:MAG: CHRD domain-containing protein [Planctomycetia bacterium]|nr:CHRD domain-containing protein [Planctomycetia bacterium]MCC7314360.1 CHRD domain-containing protein [Planctomycetota bacterium]OQZ06222.1 MAG: hypothetical protein B6D36_06120 [Planctomycetes bacterium UTPLA1]
MKQCTTLLSPSCQFRHGPPIRWNAAAITLAVLIAAMASGAAQAAIVHFVADPINSANECPACTSAQGSGCGAFTLDTATGNVNYYIVHNQAGETAAHVHGAAGVCPATAGVLKPLPVGFLKVGTYNLTAAQQADMQASRHYVNIHTGVCPSGAIRGQIVPVTATAPCCLPNNVCMTTLPSTCQCLGGTPGPVGAACTQREACCLPGAACVDVDPVCCTQMGGMPQGAGTNCVTTVCQQQTCEVLPDGSACQPVQCPGDGQECIPRCMNFNPSTGQIKIIDCDCRSPNECHVEFGAAGLTCVGACPPGFHCETTTNQLPDGSVEVCCDCIEDPPYMNWVIADDFCINPSCPECRCDFDGDGVCTTFGDFQMLVNCFGPVTPACQFADLNCDGVVNAADEQIWACLAGGNPPELCCPDVVPPRMPITDIQWYGSYLDPEYDPSITPVPRPIDGWLIAIHRDIAPQPCPPGTNYDACGIISPPNALGCVTFLPDGAAVPIPLTPPVGPGCAVPGCVIPPPGYWRICARYLPDCNTPCAPAPGALCVLQHLPCETGISRPDRLVAQWAFNPQAVPFFNTGLIGWDQHTTFCYSTRLAAGCLVHNNAGPDEIDPALPGIFNPRPGVTYWLSIQAEVGHFISPPPQCVESPTGNMATGDFWGWHTTPPGYHMKDDAYMGKLGMSCRGGWVYNWMNHLHWGQPEYIGCADDPTKSMDMAFYLICSNGTAGKQGQVIWCQPHVPGPPPPTDPPPPARPIPPGTIDTLIDTHADVVIEFFPPGPPIVNLTADGPTRVWRDNPDIQPAATTIQTEILSLDLTGNAPFGPVTIREQPEKHSSGQIFGPGSEPFLPYPYWPVDSFFDVFVEIELPNAPPGFQNLFNSVPAHMTAPSGLWELPPNNVDYVGPGDPVLLFDESNPNQPVGQIISIRHGVGYRGGIDVHSDTDWVNMPMFCSCKGDLNLDGLLNGLDIQRFINCLLNPPPPPVMLGCPCDCADMNNDGVATVADINPFVNQLMEVPKAVCPPDP